MARGRIRDSIVPGSGRGHRSEYLPGVASPELGDNAQGPTRVGAVGPVPRAVVGGPERGGDQWRERLDVGAHDDDVAGLERRVVGEQAQEHLAEHVDLAGDPVAAVHLHRPVACGEVAARRTHLVGAQVGLQPAEEGPPLGSPGGIRVVVDVGGVGDRSGVEGPLQLAQEDGAGYVDRSINDNLLTSSLRDRDWSARNDHLGLECQRVLDRS